MVKFGLVHRSAMNVRAVPPCAGEDARTTAGETPALRSSARPRHRGQVKLPPTSCRDAGAIIIGRILRSLSIPPPHANLRAATAHARCRCPLHPNPGRFLPRFRLPSEHFCQQTMAPQSRLARRPERLCLPLGYQESLYVHRLTLLFLSSQKRMLRARVSRLESRPRSR